MIINRLKNKGVLGLVMCFICFTSVTQAEEVETTYQYRTELKLGFEPINNVKLSVTPQIRFDENFAADKYYIEGALGYKAQKWLSMEMSYRMGMNPRDNKSTKYYNRFALSAEAQKKWGDFTPSLQVKYTNDADDDDDNELFMRYKLGLEYNIPNCKITPSAAVEAFQQLDGNDLYKMRYSLGADYKIKKNNYIGIKYKFDYYELEYENSHILTLTYKVKF